MELLKFSSKGCAPCAALSKLIEQNAHIFSHVPVVDVDYDLHKDLFTKHSVRAVPTIVLVDGSGSELARKDKCSWGDLVSMAGIAKG